MHMLKIAVSMRTRNAVLIGLYVALLTSTLLGLDHFFPAPPALSLGTLP